MERFTELSTDGSRSLQQWDMEVDNQDAADDAVQIIPIINHIVNAQEKHYRLNQHRFGGPSIDDLSNEVLKNIFKLASEMASPFHTGKLEDDVPPRVELKIASTCFKWRTTSTSQPELWKIAFTVPVLYNNHAAEALELYLRQFYSRKIDVWLTFFAEVPDRVILPMLDTLLVHSSRMRHLGILFSDGAPKGLILRQILMGCNSDILEKLEIHVDPQNEDDETLLTDYTSMTGNINQLKLLRSSAAFFDGQRPCLSQLTTLYLEWLTTYFPHSPSNFFADIIDLPNLITLSVAEDTFGSRAAARPTIPLVASSHKHFRCGDTALAKLVLVNAYFPELELLILHHIYLKTIAFPSHNNHSSDMPPPILAPKLQTLALIDCKSNTRSSTLLVYATSSDTHLVIDTVREPHPSNVMEFILVDPAINTQFLATPGDCYL